jgi:hypothetical protein
VNLWLTDCGNADNDCGAAVKNVPVCANSTWNMFQIEQVGNRDFFCCPNGYIGVLPSSGAAGICEASGANIPVSRLATMASQIGGTSVTPFGGSPTATLSGVAPHTTVGGITTATGSTGQSATVTSGSGPPTGSSSPGDGIGTSALSIGAIVGIAIGAVAVLVLAITLVLWLHRRSLRKHPPQAVVHQPTYQPPPQEHHKSLGEPQMYQTGSEQPVTPTPGYWLPQGRSEVAGISRVEMEVPGYRAEHT